MMGIIFFFFILFLLYGFFSENDWITPHTAPEYISCFNEGRAYLVANKYLKAIHCFNTCIKLQPFYAPAYYYKGLSLYHLGDVDGAIDNIKKALDLNPVSWIYLEKLGLIYKGIGRFELGERYLVQSMILKGKR